MKIFVGQELASHSRLREACIHRVILGNCGLLWGHVYEDEVHACGIDNSRRWKHL